MTDKPQTLRDAILFFADIDEAFEIGRSDVASGASGSPLPCGCSQCAASYLDGVHAEINANKVIIEPSKDDTVRRIS